jgi:hypothetical protein
MPGAVHSVGKGGLKQQEQQEGKDNALEAVNREPLGFLTRVDAKARVFVARAQVEEACRRLFLGTLPPRLRIMGLV